MKSPGPRAAPQAHGETYRERKGTFFNALVSLASFGAEKRKSDAAQQEHRTKGNSSSGPSASRGLEKPSITSLREPEDRGGRLRRSRARRCRHLSRRRRCGLW